MSGGDFALTKAPALRNSSEEAQQTHKQHSTGSVALWGEQQHRHLWPRRRASGRQLLV